MPINWRKFGKVCDRILPDLTLFVHATISMVLPDNLMLFVVMRADVYSARNLGKEHCFRLLKKKYGGGCKFLAIGVLFAAMQS